MTIKKKWIVSVYSPCVYNTYVWIPRLVQYCGENNGCICGHRCCCATWVWQQKLLPHHILLMCFSLSERLRLKRISPFFMLSLRIWIGGCGKVFVLEGIRHCERSHYLLCGVCLAVVLHCIVILTSTASFSSQMYLAKQSHAAVVSMSQNLPIKSNFIPDSGSIYSSPA